MFMRQIYLSSVFDSFEIKMLSIREQYIVFYSAFPVNQRNNKYINITNMSIPFHISQKNRLKLNELKLKSQRVSAEQTVLLANISSLRNRKSQQKSQRYSKNQQPQSNEVQYDGSMMKCVIPFWHHKPKVIRNSLSDGEVKLSLRGMGGVGGRVSTSMQRKSFASKFSEPENGEFVVIVKKTKFIEHEGKLIGYVVEVGLVMDGIVVKAYPMNGEPSMKTGLYGERAKLLLKEVNHQYEQIWEKVTIDPKAQTLTLLQPSAKPYPYINIIPKTQHSSKLKIQKNFIQRNYYDTIKQKQPISLKQTEVIVNKFNRNRNKSTKQWRRSMSQHDKEDFQVGFRNSEKYIGGVKFKTKKERQIIHVDSKIEQDERKIIQLLDEVSNTDSYREDFENGKQNQHQLSQQEKNYEQHFHEEDPDNVLQLEQRHSQKYQSSYEQKIPNQPQLNNSIDKMSDLQQSIELENSEKFQQNSKKEVPKQEKDQEQYSFEFSQTIQNHKKNSLIQYSEISEEVL